MTRYFRQDETTISVPNEICSHLRHPDLVVIVAFQGWAVSRGRVKGGRVLVDPLHGFVDRIGISGGGGTIGGSDGRKGRSAAEGGSKEEGGGDNLHFIRLECDVSSAWSSASGLWIVVVRFAFFVVEVIGMLAGTRRQVDRNFNLRACMYVDKLHSHRSYI